MAGDRARRPTHGKAQEYGAKAPFNDQPASEAGANLAGNVARRPARSEAAQAAADPESAANLALPAVVLLDHGLDRDVLEGAARLAARWGVPVHEVLLSTGRMTEQAYVDAVAVRLRCAVLPYAFTYDTDTRDHDERPPWLLAVRAGAIRGLLIDAVATEVDEIERHVRRMSRDGRPVWVAAADLIKQVNERLRARACLDEARFGLHRRTPENSAAGRQSRWQCVTLLALTAIVCCAASIALETTAAIVSVILAVPFLGVSVLRTAALLEAVRRRPKRPANADNGRHWDDRTLPVYSIIVPLFEEAEVLPELIGALSALDYPAAKLDVMLVLEAVDRVTPKRLAMLALPPFFRVITVPDAAPRTKPKAANYALQFARGDYVVVYDAEDRPEPGQLRAAIAAFARGGERVACVQARLNIYNAHRCWLSRQFAIEYTSLFDAVLPALMRLGVPIPLDGTSNHFPRRVLLEIGAWDPYNVTEDADLGVRLARHGWTTAIIESTTWEEAPVAFGVWFRQRTRWMKGWLQTYLVHTRFPVRLRRDLGRRGTIGFHAFSGGLILSALIHPIFWVLLLTGGADWFVSAPEQDCTAALWWIAWINLLFGYVVSILLGAVTLIKRRAWWLLPSTLTVPVYWLLISAATYRAVYQFATDPYRWEKTPHGAAVEDDEGE
jgi:glycosyltransferase XagB